MKLTEAIILWLKGINDPGNQWNIRFPRTGVVYAPSFFLTTYIGGGTIVGGCTLLSGVNTLLKYRGDEEQGFYIPRVSLLPVMVSDHDRTYRMGTLQSLLNNLFAIQSNSLQSIRDLDTRILHLIGPAGLFRGDGTPIIMPVIRTDSQHVRYRELWINPIIFYKENTLEAAFYRALQRHWKKMASNVSSHSEPYCSLSININPDITNLVYIPNLGSPEVTGEQVRLTLTANIETIMANLCMNEAAS